MSNPNALPYRLVRYRLVEDRHGKRIEITHTDPRTGSALPPAGAATAGPAAAPMRGGAGLSPGDDG